MRTMRITDEVPSNTDVVLLKRRVTNVVRPFLAKKWATHEVLGPTNVVLSETPPILSRLFGYALGYTVTLHTS